MSIDINNVVIVMGNTDMCYVLACVQVGVCAVVLRRVSYRHTIVYTVCCRQYAAVFTYYTQLTRVSLPTCHCIVVVMYCVRASMCVCMYVCECLFMLLYLYCTMLY